MKQKERQERSRKEIFQAAMEEFGSNDYDKVTMESICTRHKISKGMMYHYYSGKDELFLQCVEAMFQMLKEYVEQKAPAVTEQNSFQAIKDYFLIREYFFEDHPQEKRIFENAMLRRPKHLAEQIREIRKPIREMNRIFIEKVVARMKLRPGLNQRQVIRYLESMEYSFRTVLLQYQEEEGAEDIHAMLKLVEEVVDMVFFGVVQRTETGSGQRAAGSEDMETRIGAGRNTGI